jgi:hypothetical protein
LAKNLARPVSVPQSVPRRDWKSANYWSEWQDLNLRPPRPEQGVPPGKRLGMNLDLVATDWGTCVFWPPSIRSRSGPSRHIKAPLPDKRNVLCRGPLDKLNGNANMPLGMVWISSRINRPRMFPVSRVRLPCECRAIHTGFSHTGAPGEIRTPDPQIRRLEVAGAALSYRA